MKAILGYIRLYFLHSNKLVLIASSIFIAMAIYLNYHNRLEINLINHAGTPFPGISARYVIYLIAFLLPHTLLWLVRRNHSKPPLAFILCLLIAPLLFAIKVGIDTYFRLSPDHDWNNYWNDIIYWPLRLILLVIMLGVIWFSTHRPEPFYGLSTKQFNYRPYLWMLLIMIPLITVASTQPDFLHVYPKMKQVLPLPATADPGFLYKLLFELSYGSDFFSIEIFFRGFLILGFIRWAGKDAILPMACFYCTIHFGKPLGECISSYFGGMLLGIVSYHTRSIWGGLMVHLGIAWMMELGGYIGNELKW